MVYWAVARVLSRRQAFAGDGLKDAGFDIFAPETRAGPLFAGYLFVRVGETWHAIDRVPGVIGLIKFGEKPARCPDCEVERLKACVDPQGYVRLPEAAAVKRNGVIPAGANVRIVAGPFAGMSAIYQGMSARQRERVLLSLLGAVRSVEVAAGLIAAR
jgi:transcriptional antiterminator RfaH